MSASLRQSYSTEVRYRGGGNFVDYMKVRIRGGNGGHGAVSFETSIRQRRGRTSGGDGGRGGDVSIVADPTLDSLQDLKTLVKAGHGDHGGRNNRVGAHGNSVIIRVPLGTTVREVQVPLDEFDDDSVDDSEFEETPGKDEFIEYDSFEGEEDFDSFEQLPDTTGGIKNEIPPMNTAPWETMEFSEGNKGPILAARGGRGGRGNMAFGKNNHDCERGQEGEERVLEFDLQTMASVGLVGMPNAGKSSLLAAISNAHPKIASYPFTTLNPYIGVIEFADGHRFTMADIPGLIEGAHVNRGLGHQFLKHISRSKMLAFVIDFSQECPWEDFEVLRSELDLYEASLSAKCQMVIANKADLLTADQLKSRVKDFKSHVYGDIYSPMIVPISALHGLAVTKVTNALRSLLEDPGSVTIRKSIESS